MAYGFKSGGRKKGSRNKLNVLVTEAAAGRADYVMATRKSLTELRRIAEWLLDKAKTAETELDDKGKPKVSEARGYLLDAVGVLKNIAEYEFPKLSAIAMQGDPDRPQVTRIEVELVESRFERAKLIEQKPAA